MLYSIPSGETAGVGAFGLSELAFRSTGKALDRFFRASGLVSGIEATDDALAVTLKRAGRIESGIRALSPKPLNPQPP